MNIPILDVRSPGEYFEGHLPFALSFPLFSDDERAEVGTIYKQVDPVEAMKKGLEIIAPKIREQYPIGVAAAKDGKIRVYCWRGGKRSEAVASMLALANLEVWVLEKGYKAFRNWALDIFENSFPIRILGGKTGTGKTEILQEIKKRGGQIIDLEKIADHRGSAFGKIGMERIVTQQQFENDLAIQLSRLDKSQPIWLEDESRRIGRLVIPESLFKQMRIADVYYVDLQREARVDRLVEEYGQFPVEEAKDSLEKIKERLGGLRYQECLTALEKGDYSRIAEITLEYYDKAYTHGLSQRDPSKIKRIEFEDFDLDKIVGILLEGSFH